MAEASQDQGPADSDSRTGSRVSKRSASKVTGDVDSDEEAESGTVRSPLFPYDSVDEALAVEYPHFHTITDMRERRLIREIVDELARKLDEERTTAAQLRARCSNLERENNRLALELGRIKDMWHPVQAKELSWGKAARPETPKAMVLDRGQLELPGRPLVTFTTTIPGVTKSTYASRVGAEDQVLPKEPTDSGSSSQDGLDLLLFAAQHVDYLDFTAPQPPPSEVYQQRACGFPA
ncbi:hypothetical protein BCR44DRAFT_1484389 [Catenaria anguillulae PL171]|uniref:Uncharacterized protein n=1 Tax=Catenaria anguillulae PL171 TaxID=765915 RepID=A0A1Y2HRX1_9FUNG|nr:hypothetical protein BCR44DRAFT_1484389 [Catenaria anguillulae PL171]